MSSSLAGASLPLDKCQCLLYHQLSSILRQSSQGPRDPTVSCLSSLGGILSHHGRGLKEDPSESPLSRFSFKLASDDLISEIIVLRLLRQGEPGPFPFMHFLLETPACQNIFPSFVHSFLPFSLLLIFTFIFLEVFFLIILFIY